MATLRRGSSGDDVVQLQERLKQLGFNPGMVDGVFGAGTEAAVRAFQASSRMLVDGVVGPRSMKALGLALEADVPLPVENVTVEVVSNMFPDAPLRNIKTHLPNILDGLVETELADKPMVLMALSTVRAESAGFEPIDEFQSRFNTSPDGHPFDLYDRRSDLGNQGPPDGERFKGRGFIQLTGRFNYERMGQTLGLGKELVEHPEIANNSEIASKILAAFLKDKELLIKDALLHDDLTTARRLVNGGRHGLDRFTECYRIGERLIV
jgi:peptidoglycan L-alanyl-D-glutamate endopeptidase CwlK